MPTTIQAKSRASKAATLRVHACMAIIDSCSCFGPSFKFRYRYNVLKFISSWIDVQLPVWKRTLICVYVWRKGLLSVLATTHEQKIDRGPQYEGKIIVVIIIIIIIMITIIIIIIQSSTGQNKNKTKRVRTFIVSKGWPTIVQATPPAVPAEVHGQKLKVYYEQ